MTGERNDWIYQNVSPKIKGMTVNGKEKEQTGT